MSAKTEQHSGNDAGRNWHTEDVADDRGVSAYDSNGVEGIGIGDHSPS